MLNYFGNKYDFKSLTNRVGDFSQVAGAKRYVLTCGKSKGVEAVDIKTGTGLYFTVLLDRAMDIAWAEYKGIPLAYMAPPGIVSSQYYDQQANEWLRSFSGGLMTTCGLSNVGEAAELNGIKFGQHGRISNLPAEHINIEEAYDGKNFSISVKGKLRQVKAFFEHWVLERTISAFAGGNSIFIRDVIENKASSREPLMLLYHFNFGFPLISEHAALVIPGMNEKNCLLDAGLKEGPPGKDTFLVKPVPDKNDQTGFLISNDRENPSLALLVIYSYRPLKNLVLWKHLYAGNYVLCLEPANCDIKGIAEEYKNGTLEYLEPFEKREIDIEIRILEGKDEIVNCQESLRNFCN